MNVEYRQIEGKSKGFMALLGGLGLVIAIALGATYYMEHNGHWVTGMDNQVVWGMPHVFALFLIVAASGALNVASISSVFNRKVYKPLARLSGLLAIALLAGGLMVLVLDLGRPDRLIVAMTYYNFKSIFAWNIILYNGFFAIVAVYLWMMMERKMNDYAKPIGFVAFTWRLILTTGTGSIFGFLVARQAFDAAIMAPMFVTMSFAYGLAVFILVLFAAYSWTGRPLGDLIVYRLKNLLGVFIAAVFYFIVVMYLTNMYATEHHGVVHFFLLGGNEFSTLFWFGQMLVGLVIPFALLYLPNTGKSRTWIGVASAMVIIGGLIQMYVTLIGAQSYPLIMFPGHEVSSSFYDGVVNSYNPSLPEFLLGIGGVAVALIATVIGMWVLRFLPASLADSAVDPDHHKAAD
jgi:molybdopterin-containing oxidoreductase family membrane subunit